MLTCQACNTDNPPDATFCRKCHTPLQDEHSDVNKTYLVTNILNEESLRSSWKWGQFLFEDDYLLILQIKDKDSQMVISPRKPIILGRASSTDESAIIKDPEITLVDFFPYDGLTAGVSRRHAQVICNGQLVMVTDLGSTNGTRINGMKLDPHTPRLLREGDELQLGKMTLLARFYKPEKLNRKIWE